MNRILYIVGLITFATSLFLRSVDPVIPPIAAGLSVETATAALLSTAFALPYAVLQPLLGPFADVMGKTRVMMASLLVLVVAAYGSALAPTFTVLLAMRVISGIAAGGVFPAGMALVGDLVPVAQRQVAMSRLLFAAMTGNLLGASLAGVVGDLIGWRGVFFMVGAIGTFAFVTALVGLRGKAVEQAPRVPLKSVPENFRAVFANPRAKICFSAVFLEGIFIFGVFPYVAVLLAAGGEARASIAGLVIGGFAAGGMLYTFLLGTLLERVGQRGLMIVGGLVGAMSLASVAFNAWWPFQLAAFVVLGLSFYLLHGAIQVYVTELAPGARGTAMSLHSTSFFSGMALGPVVYGVLFPSIGTVPSLLIGAGMVVLVMIVSVRRLTERGGA